MLGWCFGQHGLELPKLPERFFAEPKEVAS